MEAARIVDMFAMSVVHSMALEDQAVELSAASRQDHVDDVIRDGKLLCGRTSRSLGEDPPCRGSGPGWVGR
jgi:hypothetical protein